MGSSRPVISTDHNLNHCTYPSATAAERATGISSRSISNVCNGRLFKAGDLLWRFAGDEFNMDLLVHIETYENVFITKATKIHNNKFIYTAVKDSTTSIDIYCKVCSKTFTQSPNNHLNGHGCPECKRNTISRLRSKSKQEVPVTFKKVHGDIYDYLLITHVGNKTKVPIGCINHGTFHQTVSDHTSGRGCPQCASSGFNPAKPAKLYYIKVISNSNIAYKVGITNNTIQRRFGSGMKIITVLKVWEYQCGEEAYQAEQNILKLNKEFKYTGEPLLKSGNTELFSIDIGGYDV